MSAHPKKSTERAPSQPQNPHRSRRPKSCEKVAETDGFQNQLKTLLEDLYAQRSSRHLANDPLSFCHRYAEPADREVAALISSSFAYGNVIIILRTLERIFTALGPSPRRFVEQFTPLQDFENFAGFKHRFNDARDLCALLWAIRLMIERNGSIEAFFASEPDRSSPDITPLLDRFSSAVLGLDYRPVFGGKEIPADSHFRFLFPSPQSGSACKRLCMFLRWVVRPADGIDLGLWKKISPAQLVIPVDTHIQRISGYLGFTRRSAADWRMAREITAALRRLDPADPVKYDFALAHLGISEGCTGTDPSVCVSCGIAPLCPQLHTAARP